MPNTRTSIAVAGALALSLIVTDADADDPAVPVALAGHATATTADEPWQDLYRAPAESFAALRVSGCVSNVDPVTQKATLTVDAHKEGEGPAGTCATVPSPSPPSGRDGATARDEDLGVITILVSATDPGSGEIVLCEEEHDVATESERRHSYRLRYRHRRYRHQQDWAAERTERVENCSAITTLEFPDPVR